MNYCKCNCGQVVKLEWATGHHRRGKTFAHTDEAREKCRLSKLGHLNPRFGKEGTQLGKKHKASSIIKIKEARAKQIITPEHCAKITKALLCQWSSGLRKKENLSFYIDGRHSSNRKAKHTSEYRIWRKSVFERDNYTCQHCNIRGGEIQADHIKPQSLFPEMVFNLDNGRTLCRPCHMLTPTWGMRVWNNKKTTTNILTVV